MPIFVSPYYNSNGSTGPIIQVGKFSRDLTTADGKSIQALVNRMKTEWSTLSVVQMYVAAIRLFDLGHRDDGVYWFYSAQYRARLLVMVSVPEKSDGDTPAEPGGRFPSHHAFFTVAGHHINHYAHRRPRMLARTIQRVANEHETPPPLRTIYPTVNFIPDSQWDDRHRELAAGLDELLELVLEIQPSQGDVATTEDIQRVMNHKTPLHQAYEAGDKKRFVKLLQDGADPNYRPRAATCLLHLTTKNHDSFWLRAVLKHGGDPDLLDTGHPYAPDISPLFSAIFARQHENVRLLLAAGADPNFVTRRGDMPLLATQNTNNWNTVLLLLDSGADPRLPESAPPYSTGYDRFLCQHYGNLSKVDRKRRQIENRKYGMSLTLEEEKALYFKLRARLIREGALTPDPKVSTDKSQ